MRLPRKTYHLFSNTAVFCASHRLIAPGRLVVAGISGGVDSMMLLAFLDWYRGETAFPLRVCHVNHMIRGGEAEKDAALVEAFCADRNLPFECIRIPVPEMAQSVGRGIEETGRAVRRAAFVRAGQRHAGMDAAFDVALAHHMDDRAESILMHMGRGSGISGLIGILPRDGVFIRPFLDARRETLVDAARELDLPWREDASNASSEYLRNRIRNELMPAWRQTLRYDPVPMLAKLGALAEVDDEALNMLAEEAYAASRLPDGSLSVSAVCALPQAVALRVLRLYYDRLPDQTAETVPQTGTAPTSATRDIGRIVSGGEKQPDETSLSHEQVSLVTLPEDENAESVLYIGQEDWDSSSPAFTFGHVHVSSLLRLICETADGTKKGGTLHLPGGRTAVVSDGRLTIRKP